MISLKTKKIYSWLPFITVSILFVCEQARILRSYEATHTDLDQTLLWYAAKEFVHGRLHEPNFYGQKYNTIFESIPGEFLHKLGLSLGLAMPLSTMLFVTAIWFLLAFMAYRLGKHKIALLALAIPVLIRVQYLVLFNAPRGILAGDFLVVVAVVCALWLCKGSATKLASLIALGGLGILWDYAAALVLVPAFVYLVFSEWPKLWIKPVKTISLTLIAAIVPLSWLLIQHEWYSGHPYDLTAPSVSITPHFATLLQSIHHLNSALAFYGPALIPVAYVSTLLFVFLSIGTIYIAIKRRSYRLLFSTISLIVIIGLELSLPRATNYLPDFYLSDSRLLVVLPIAIWVLLLLVALDKGANKHKKHPKYRESAYAIWLIVLVTIVSFGVTQYAFHRIVSKAVSADVNSHMVINPVDTLISCQGIDKVYTSSGAQLYATNDANIAYGCAAQYDGLNTIQPVYDRRGWIIKASYTQPSERILISGSSCDIKLPKDATCTLESGSLLLITTVPTPAAATLSVLGLPVRYASSGND